MFPYKINQGRLPVNIDFDLFELILSPFEIRNVHEKTLRESQISSSFYSMSSKVSKRPLFIFKLLVLKYSIKMRVIEVGKIICFFKF